MTIECIVRDGMLVPTGPVPYPDGSYFEMEQTGPNSFLVTRIVTDLEEVTRILAERDKTSNTPND